MSTRIKVILVFIGFGLLVIIPLVWWAASGFNQDSTIVTDRDTGEVYDPSVNNDNTGGGSNAVSSTQLFGIQPLTDKLLSSNEKVGYINSVKEALWQFSKERLNDKFTSITLRPDGLVITDTEISGTIRLGQTNETLPITIKPNNLKKEAIITINQAGNQYGGAFIYIGGINSSNNLLFTLSQPDHSSNEITIQSYAGYYDAAFDYLLSIGYNVPDLNIKIVGRENEI